MAARTKKSATTPLDNAAIANLLACESENAEYPLKKALRRASRRAFIWPEEAAQLIQQRRSLTELAGVGPYLEKLIRRWLEEPPTPPEQPAIRQGFLTIPQARAVLASDPSWRTGLKGDLQMHSKWSDGLGTIQEMADAAVERDYEYIAITDHAKGLKIAHGIDEEQVRQQAVEIRAINDSLERAGKHTRILRSIELNLSPDGRGDMDEHCLEHLDVVLGCFHSALRRKEDQTERYIAALRNPAIQILGHPRGRIYNYRIGLTAHWRRVCDEAAKLDKALEIDAYPDRQDLSFELLVVAKQAGCRISLGTDSHHPSDLAFIDLGLASALKAGIKRERILNFMTAETLLKWARTVRHRGK